MILVFAPKQNSRFKKDADEFRRQAENFINFHGKNSKEEATLSVIDNSVNEVLQQSMVLDVMKRFAHQASSIVFFCHGFKNHIQFGFRGPGGAKLLAKASHDATRDFDGIARHIFYACSLGKDEDNWGNWYCDELERNKAAYWSVFHETAGHTSKNPYCEYRGATRSYSGAARVIRNGSPVWNLWVKAMQTDFCFEFPYLTPQQITTRLLGHPINYNPDSELDETVRLS